MGIAPARDGGSMYLGRMAEILGRHVVLIGLRDIDIEPLRRLRPADWSTSQDWPVEPSNAQRYGIWHGQRLVGFIQSSEETDPQFRHAGIDIFLARGSQGQGLGTDAVHTLASHLVHSGGHHRLVIDPLADNFAAIRCYEKVGFRPVGTLRQYQYDFTARRWRDGLLMELLADALPPHV